MAGSPAKGMSPEVVAIPTQIPFTVDPVSSTQMPVTMSSFVPPIPPQNRRLAPEGSANDSKLLKFSLETDGGWLYVP